MNDAFTRAIRAMDEEALQSLYGRWEALTPTEVAALLAPTGIRWWIAGGRAARVGVTDRHHSDTDVAIRIGDLDQLRERLSDWDLWEANDGALRPLLDRADLAAARLDPDARAWLAQVLAELGYLSWADAVVTRADRWPA